MKLDGSKEVYLGSSELFVAAENPTQKIVAIRARDLKPGHRLFELDLEKMEIRPAEIVKTEMTMINKKLHYEVKINDKCLYAPALNAQNAEKRFKKKLSRNGVA
jgi:hypothetical protein